MQPAVAADPSRQHIIEGLRAVAAYKTALKSSGDLKLTPRDINIEGQKKDEQIFLYIRRHWSANINWVVRNFIYSLLPIFLYLIWENLPTESLDFLTVKEVVIITVAYYSLIFTNVIKDFFDWYFDPYIITNERIIYYEFRPFSRYIVQESLLESIQKIQEKAGGILSNFFGYGTLEIGIEGPNEKFILKNIPEPTMVRSIISDLSKISKKYGQ